MIRYRVVDATLDFDEHLRVCLPVEPLQEVFATLERKPQGNPADCHEIRWKQCAHNHLPKAVNSRRFPTLQEELLRLRQFLAINPELASLIDQGKPGCQKLLRVLAASRSSGRPLPSVQQTEEDLESDTRNGAKQKLVMEEPKLSLQSVNSSVVMPYDAEDELSALHLDQKEAQTLNQPLAVTLPLVQTNMSRPDSYISFDQYLDPSLGPAAVHTLNKDEVTPLTNLRVQETAVHIGTLKNEVEEKKLTKLQLSRVLHIA